jgi:hypothetical protein
VLNRICRVFALARARYCSKGRHRRALTPSCPPASPLASHESAGVSTPFLGWATVDVAPHRTLLRGEDVALVRPYVLASERRVRAGSMSTASHLTPDGWAFLAGGY